MQRTPAVLLVVFLTLGILSVPGTPATTWSHAPQTHAGVEGVETSATSSPLLGPIRVAVYDEPNTTTPAYISGFSGNSRNNVSAVVDILAGDEYNVTLLDVHDIYNRALSVSMFDVLVLPDNLPRENITDRVIDFWLSGGGVLALDGSAQFFCQMGVLPPESAGANGYGVYWKFITSDLEIGALHPMTHGYNVGDTFDVTSNMLKWNWTALQETSIADDVVRVAWDAGNPNWVSALAFDPSDRGGKIATIAHDLHSDYLPGLDSMIRNTVDWLRPRPKARIAFDYLHNPYYGVDDFDSGMAQIAGRYADYRDLLVSHRFTFDKLYPSLYSNITPGILSRYDMLIILLPRVNFTNAEVTVLQEWVDSGGSLLLLGD